jgi:hypothetical protein
MPKDATRNIDRYKIRGGHLNAFDFHRNQGAISQQEEDDWVGGQPNTSDLPPDQAKAERVRRLLAEHGDSVPEPVKELGFQTAETKQARNQQNRANVSAKENTQKTVPEPDTETVSKKFTPTHGRSPQVIKEMVQSRRATDVVPEPADVAAGRTGASARREKAGLPANASTKPARPRPLTRKENKATAKADDSQAKARSERTKTASATQKKASKKVVKASSSQQTVGTSTRKATASTKSKPSTSRKSTKKATIAKSTKQTVARRSTKKVSASKPASKNLSQTRKTSSDNQARTSKSGQTTKAKVQTKSVGRKSR